ncbi:hypothetical protein HYT00_01360 [Candidatus Giovannonibacteria bacterium]|nr:hypothetical protein [Candidatus Giovannonibacteria bacterium]
MRTTFSIEEVAVLKQNPNVFSCTERSINYTYEFKKHALENSTSCASIESTCRSSSSVDFLA